MAFNIDNFTQHSVAGIYPDVGQFVWDYTTSENMSAIYGHTDYFTGIDVAYRIRKGDWVRVTAADGYKLFYVVNSSPNGLSPSESSTNVAAFLT